MPAQITGFDDGQLTLRLSGRLLQSDLAAVQHQAAGLIDVAGSVRILVLAEAFEGWEQGAAWDDFSFQESHDARIERMAIVGEERWRDLALLFASQGLRPFPIEYFPPERYAQALAWLAGGPG